MKQLFLWILIVGAAACNNPDGTGGQSDDFVKAWAIGNPEGDTAVLKLRYIGQTWNEPSPVHIELCDFILQDKAWKDRKQGEWVEAAASIRLIHPLK